jgi:tetratricopeptide (TPR) repeat protein
MENLMSKDFAALKADLQQGLALSQQGSYERRLPAKAALPLIRSALKGLRALSPQEATAEFWRTLALAEEALLHYPAAVEALERAVALSQPADRKDLKRLAQLREYAAKWEALGLTPAALEALGAYLEEKLGHEPCDHSHRHTDAWLASSGVKSRAKALRSLQAVGGYCDCEVLANAV